MSRVIQRCSLDGSLRVQTPLRLSNLPFVDSSSCCGWAHGSIMQRGLSVPEICPDEYVRVRRSACSCVDVGPRIL